MNEIGYVFHVCCHLNLLSSLPLVSIGNSTSAGAYVIYQLDILHMSSPIYISVFTYLLIVQF